ncbi:hypothetical protein CRG95_00960 [Escherichia sp. E4208]|nr:hypothetical protein CRG95_00960 [Escherichia sp. E4208]
MNCSGSRLAPVLLSGLTSQRAGVFSFQQPMPPGIKPLQHCASPDNSGLVSILRLNLYSLHP